MSNSKVIGPSSGTSTASGSKSGSLIAENFSSSVICVMLSISSEPFTWSVTSLRKRASTSLRGARPARKPGTAAVSISSLKALSK